MHKLLWACPLAMMLAAGCTRERQAPDSEVVANSGTAAAQVEEPRSGVAGDGARVKIGASDGGVGTVDVQNERGRGSVQVSPTGAAVRGSEGSVKVSPTGTSVRGDEGSVKISPTGTSVRGGEGSVNVSPTGTTIRGSDGSTIVIPAPGK